MRKQIAIVLAAAACTLATGAARAGGVSWSVGINAPVVGAVISNGPFYHAPPVVYVPGPAYGGGRGERARWEHERHERERDRWQRERWEHDHARERRRGDRWER